MKGSAALFLALWLAGCGGAKGRSDGARKAVIMVQVAQPDASIWVDGHFVTEVAQAKGGVALKPGTHRIEIRHDRFHTHYEIVEVRAKERRTLQVELAEELP